MTSIIKEQKIHPGPEMIEEITLAGRSVRLIHRDVPLESVKLDRKNQRVQFFLRFEKKKTHDMTEKEIEGALEKVLWKLSEVKGLYTQIKTNHGLMERIIIRDDGTVVEGNCRTIIYRKLKKEEPNDPRWANIEARILPPDIEESQVSLLLGIMHVAGKNEWDAYEKAAYLHHMHEDLGIPLDALADQLKMSKPNILKSINAFRLQGEFLEKYPDPKNIYKFSYFLEFFKKYPKVEDYTPLEADFIEVVGQGRFERGENVRDLPKIIKEPKAYETLKTKGFAEAKEVLKEEDPSFGSKFFAMVDKMTKSFKSIAKAEDIAKLRDGDPHSIEKIQGLYDELIGFARLAGIKLK